jgi:hypothetical protein
MTSGKPLARESKGWWIWALASAVVIVADMAIHGVTSLNILPALLSIAFAGIMYTGKRAEDFVTVLYQERPPLVGRTKAMPLATRVTILRSLEKGLWALWFVLLASTLAFPLVGDLNLSWDFTVGMIVLALMTIPLRIFISAALFR